LIAGFTYKIAPSEIELRSERQLSLPWAVAISINFKKKKKQKKKEEERKNEETKKRKKVQTMKRLRGFLFYFF
jgi:hypothetical protein